MNQQKTKVMIGNISNVRTQLNQEAYDKRNTNIGTSFIQKMKEMMICPKCDAKFQNFNLQKHMSQIHNITLNSKTSKITENPETVSVKKDNPGCPKKNCSFKTSTVYRLRKHFAFRHPQDTLEISNCELIRCDKCKMFINKSDNLDKHEKTEICIQLSTRITKLKRVEKCTKAKSKNFMVNDKEIDKVNEFKYLGRWVNDKNNDWLAIKNNMNKAKQRWSHVRKILVRDNANRKTMAYFYKAVVQSVLLYGSETWVPSSIMMRKLNAFHNKIARNIMNRNIQPDPNDESNWIYPDMKEVLKDAGLFTIEEYIERRRKTVLNFAQSNSEHYKNCLESKEKSNKTYWWNQ